MFAKVLCVFKGHAYRPYAKPKESWAKGIRWLRCTRCGHDLALHDGLRIALPMDYELMDMHEWELVDRVVL